MRNPLHRLQHADVGPPVDDPEQEPVAGPPIATATEQLTAAVVTRAWSVLLAACLVLGPVGAAFGLYAVVTRAPGAAAAPRATPDDAEDRLVVAEFGQRVVVAWLTATQDRPGELLALIHPAQPPTLPRTSLTVSAPTVSRVHRVTDADWSVTVSATVTDARHVTARRYYQIPIDYAGGELTALTLPAPISGPQLGASPESAYGNELAASSAAGSTVAQFLGAYLTGAGDAARYVTPGVTITALSPAPYSSLRLDELSTTDDGVDAAPAPTDGQRLPVLATATAAVNAQQTYTVTYALTLTGRGGRWEINAIDPAPIPPAQAPGELPAGADQVPTTPAGTTPATTNR